MTTSDRFDAAYYRRYYGRRPVHDRHTIGVLATGVTSMASWWKLPIRSVLDVGAGKGYWRDWLAAERPKVHYHGIDTSAYACRRWGHEQADLATWEPDRHYDLVVCQSVMQYLSDRDATRAIAVLSRASRGLLFFEAPTIDDHGTVIAPDRSDSDIHWRSGRWYRSRLDRSFREIGAGLWVKRDPEQPFFELERTRSGW